MILGFYVQALGIGIPSQFLSSLPYLVTIVALVVISGNRTLTRVNTPACLGRSFVPDR
jgi:simple sugar transport system permease protein